MSGGYWEIKERVGIRELEVTLRGFHPPSIEVPCDSSAMPGRLLPLLHVASAAAWSLSSTQSIRKFAIQIHDEDPEREDCLRFDAEASSTKVLLPDPYALGSKGFQEIRNEFHSNRLPTWKERVPLAFWRGASTGNKALTLTRLKTNLRYQLCRLSLEEPELLDARITGVVQGRDANATAQIQQHLVKANLMAPSCPAWMFGLHRHLIEIDGNVNSWGLLWKLLSGSCILKVESSRRQWYHHKLKPYIHVVPIAKDLSNLTEQLEWCVANPDQCELIAYAGRDLALQETRHLGRRVLEAINALTIGASI